LKTEQHLYISERPHGLCYWKLLYVARLFVRFVQMPTAVARTCVSQWLCNSSTTS
jgi:hypothetical protein